MKEPSKRMVRWICKLTEYSPDIRHIPPAVDALSRQDHKGFEIKGDDPIFLLCLKGCHPTSYNSIPPFRLQDYDSNGYDSHTKRLHHIEVSSDVEASDISDSSQSD